MAVMDEALWTGKANSSLSLLTPVKTSCYPLLGARGLI